MSYREANGLIRTTGMAKPSQYAVYFAGPFDIIPVEGSRRLSINCEEAFFPSKNIFTADVRHYGNGYKFPYSHEFTNEITMIFRVGADFYEKRVFEEWMNKIINVDSFDHEYYDNYASQIAIAQINNNNITRKDDNDSILGNLVDRFKEGIDNQLPEVDIFGRKDDFEAPRIGAEDITYQAVLQKAYPIGIMELPLGYGSTNTYHRIGITFTFKKWSALPQLVSGDIKSQAIRNSNELDSELEQTQKQAVNGGIINTISRGVEQYGPAFRSGRGNISF